MYDESSAPRSSELLVGAREGQRCMDCSSRVAEVMAVIFLSMVPVLTVYLVAQNYVV